MDRFSLSAGFRVTALTACLFCSAAIMPAQQADNTAMNKGDASKTAMTADKQKGDASDRALTQKIRKAVVGDKSLSTYAHNVKIISQNGMVTLKGPVRSDSEKQNIIAKATEAAGSADKVTDQMSVAPSSK